MRRNFGRSENKRLLVCRRRALRRKQGRERSQLRKTLASPDSKSKRPNCVMTGGHKMRPS